MLNIKDDIEYVNDYTVVGYVKQISNHVNVSDFRVDKCRFQGR